MYGILSLGKKALSAGNVSIVGVLCKGKGGAAVYLPRDIRTAFYLYLPGEQELNSPGFSFPLSFNYHTCVVRIYTKNLKMRGIFFLF